MNKSIIKYITGDLSGKQKVVFDEILRHSPELNEIKDNYRNLIKQVDDTSDIPLNPAYFASLIPSFRARLETYGHRQKTYRWSYSLSTLAALIILGVFLFQPRKTTDLQDVISELNHNEVKAMVEELQIDIIPADTENVQKIEDLYLEEIAGKDQIIIASDIVSSTDIINTLSEEDTKMIYDEMINKDILKD